MNRYTDIVRFRREWDGWYRATKSTNESPNSAVDWVKENPLSEKTLALRTARANSGYGADLPWVLFRPWGDYLREHPDARTPPREFHLPYYAVRCISGRTRFRVHPDCEQVLKSTIIEENEKDINACEGPSIAPVRGRSHGIITSGVRAKSSPPLCRQTSHVLPPRDGYKILKLARPDAIVGDGPRELRNGGYELTDRTGRFALRCSEEMVYPHPVQFLTKGFVKVWTPRKEKADDLEVVIKDAPLLAFDRCVGFTYAICRLASSQDLYVCAFCGDANRSAHDCDHLRRAVAENNFYLEGVRPIFEPGADLPDGSFEKNKVDASMYDVCASAWSFITSSDKIEGNFSYMRNRLWQRLVYMLDHRSLNEMVTLYRTTSHLFRHFPLFRGWSPKPAAFHDEKGLDVDYEKTGWNHPDVESKENLELYEERGDAAASSRSPAAGFLRVAVRAGVARKPPRADADKRARQQQNEEARAAFLTPNAFPFDSRLFEEPASWARRRRADRELVLDGDMTKAVRHPGFKRQRRDDSPRERRRRAPDDYEKSAEKRRCWADTEDSQ